MSKQSSSFFDLVEVTLNGLCPIFHRTVFLSFKNLPWVCRSAIRMNSFSNFVDQSFWTLITCAGHTTRWHQSSVYLTNRFQVAVCLFSNRSQMMSKCGKNNLNVWLVCHWCSYHILTSSVIHVLLNRRTATWNLFVLYNEQKGKTNLPCSAWLFDLCQLRHFQSH